MRETQNTLHFSVAFS